MPSDNINATLATTQHRRPPPTLPHQLLSTADAAAILHQVAGPPALTTNAESIPCPRCDSKNTKFCYYNNYNLSQPRHFCKGCRRYWTHGGTLRNVPVGGGTRKSASISSSSSSNKRPRCSPTIVSPCSSPSSLAGHDGVGVGTTVPQTARLAGVKGVSAPCLGLGFSSFMNAPGSNAFLALGGQGPGYMPALDGIGFGFGKGVWSFPDTGFVEGAGYGCFRRPIIGPAGVDAWHVEGGTARDGEGGSGGSLIDGEVFALPELAISMPGQGLK